MIESLKSASNDMERVKIIHQTFDDKSISFIILDKLPYCARIKWSSNQSAIYRYFDTSSINVIFKTTKTISSSLN